MHDAGGVISSVTVRMDAPVRENRRWICTYLIAGRPAPRCGAGVDSFQAIQAALDGIRAYLDAQDGTFAHLHAANDAGFPRSIPTKYGLAFSSGVAATDAVIKLLKPGDEVIAGNDMYGGTYRLFTKVFEKFGSWGRT